MVATKPKQDGFRTEFNRIPALQAKIQHATVKLSSLRFKASGVILTSDATNVYVLTALHNVYILAEKDSAPEWSDALVTAFKKDVKIKYGEHLFGAEPADTAAITAAKPIHLDPAKKNWEYDILLLKSDKPEFKTYAATHTVYPAFSDAGVFVTESWQYLARGVAKKPPNVFLQTGYGKIDRTVVIFEGEGRRRTKSSKKVFPADKTPKNKGTNVEGKLQYRIAPPTSAETTSVYQQVGVSEDYNECKHCIVLPADANDSTEVGDSGGHFLSPTMSPRGKPMSWRSSG